jgi:hypothetical protein
MTCSTGLGSPPAPRAIHVERRIAILAALSLFIAFPAAAQTSSAARPTGAPVRIEINAIPIDAFEPRDPSIRQFGGLMFRGGLVLTSSYKDFGGLSAIRVFADGSRFIALSDRGRWLTGRIVYEREHPIGIADAVMAPILGSDGRPLASRGWYDTESLAEDGGTLYVGIERVNRIVRFDFAKQGLLARGQPIAVPPGIATLPHNRGLECLVVAPKGLPLAGTLIAISERGLDDAGNIMGFLIGGQTPGEFTVKRKDDFDVTDCAITPSGDLLLLERRFTWVSGVALRIRRVVLADVKPSVLVDGPHLLSADMGFQIDNMEGLSVHRTAAGDVVLTLVSDDNFSLLQRTILLQFTLIEP